jgi:hypothetical protein
VQQSLSHSVISESYQEFRHDLAGGTRMGAECAPARQLYPEHPVDGSQRGLVPIADMRDRPINY